MWSVMALPQKEGFVTDDEAPIVQMLSTLKLNIESTLCEVCV